MSVPSVAEEFIYSTDLGAIVKFEKEKDLTFSGAVCIPSSESFCVDSAFTGENVKGQYIFNFENIYGKKDLEIRYINKTYNNTYKESGGYSVWVAVSPDVPEGLRVLKSPISKIDPISTDYLAKWAGNKDNLTPFFEHSGYLSYANRVFSRLGYAASQDSVLPIVVPRKETALWEAVAKRVDPAGLSITNNGAASAMIVVSNQIAKVAFDNNEDLLRYTVPQIDSNKSAFGVFDDDTFLIKVKSSNLFDVFAESNSNINSISSDLISLLSSLSPTQACVWRDSEELKFSIVCVVHSDDMGLREKKLFVTTLFAFVVGGAHDGYRTVNIVQLTRGGGNKKENGAPSPEQFTLLPEQNSDVKFIRSQLRQNLKNLIALKYPGN